MKLGGILRRCLLSPSLSSTPSGGENPPDFVRALRPVTSKAFGLSSPSLPDAGGRRGLGRGGISFWDGPSLRLSPRSFLTERERKHPSQPPVTGQGARRAGEEEHHQRNDRFSLGIGMRPTVSRMFSFGMRCCRWFSTALALMSRAVTTVPDNGNACHATRHEPRWSIASLA